MAWTRAAALAELTDGCPLLAIVGDEEVALYRVNGAVYATDDLCSHAEASLAEGDLRGYIIECPRHGGAFDIRTGEPKHFPAFSPIRTFPVKIEEGSIWIDTEA
ncbi:MAG: non-heme iron oxygenase ferredoxin subunit [Thermaerobacter sp.]|nr:non-heme iron oxygenase ferredoxin subunit [Thermaerobacter sp.]